MVFRLLLRFSWCSGCSLSRAFSCIRVFHWFTGCSGRRADVAVRKPQSSRSNRDRRRENIENIAATLLPIRSMRIRIEMHLLHCTKHTADTSDTAVREQLTPRQVLRRSARPGPRRAAGKHGRLAGARARAGPGRRPALRGHQVPNYEFRSKNREKNKISSKINEKKIRKQYRRIR